MKNPVLASLALILGFLLVPVSQAAPQAQNASTPQLSDTQVCSMFSGLAKQMMTARQNGASMEEMMEVATNSGNDAVNQITKAMVIEAYEIPRFSLPENKQNAINDFADHIYLTCIKS